MKTTEMYFFSNQVLFNIGMHTFCLKNKDLKDTIFGFKHSNEALLL